MRIAVTQPGYELKRRPAIAGLTLNLFLTSYIAPQAHQYHLSH